MDTPLLGRDAQEQELHLAAFHAWFTLGEILSARKSGRRVTTEEIEGVYALLSAALKRYDPPA